MKTALYKIQEVCSGVEMTSRGSGIGRRGIGMKPSRAVVSKPSVNGQGHAQCVSFKCSSDAEKDRTARLKIWVHRRRGAGGTIPGDWPQRYLDETKQCCRIEAISED